MMGILRRTVTSMPADRSHRRRTLSRLASGAAIGCLAALIPLRGTSEAGDFNSLQWANRAIHLTQAWQVVPGRGAGVRVCDVDTGMMLTHPDLREAIAGGTNTANPAAPDTYADDAGHGTYTAGIMVARGVDIWGVAPGASLLVAKALNQGDGDANTVTSAVLWCVGQGAKVVNLSLGVSAKRWDGFLQAIRYGCMHGVDFAVAAGNDAWPNEQINPANIDSPCLVAVNASDRQNRLADFSNFYENRRSITAPGQVIISDWTNGGVTLGSGTSASAPLVAGVMALLRSQGANAQEAVQMVLSSAYHPPHVAFVHGRNDHLGYGILDAGAACRMFQRLHIAGRTWGN